MRNNKLFILGVLSVCACVIILCVLDSSVDTPKFYHWLNISQYLLIAGILLVAFWTLLKLRK